MKLPELYYASSKCLTLDSDKEFSKELQAKLASGQWDINEIIRFCSEHLVITALYLQLKKAGLLYLLPDDFTAHLNDLYEGNIERNKSILKQIDEISHALAENKIDHIYLKGTAYLLDLVYTDPGERIIGDIDFLIDKADLNRCIETLKNIGYYNPKEAEGDILSYHHHHYAHLVKDDRVVNVEIHHSPVALKFYRYCPTEQVFQDKKVINQAIHQFVPSDNQKVLINFIHSRLNNGGHSRFLMNLREMADLSKLAQRVDIYRVLSEFPDKHKSMVYYALFRRYFKNNEKFEIIQDSGINRYLLIFDLMNKHPKLIKYFFGLISFPKSVYGYFSKLIKAVYRKDYRQYIFYRLKDPNWYKQHFILVVNKLKRFFR